MRVATLLAGLMALACASPASALAQDKAAPNAGAKADGFGTVLPAGLTASALVALIAPGRDASLATLVGAKAWPHRANTFVAIACFARSKKELESEQKYSKGPSCEKFYQPGQAPEFVDPPVYLGVVQHQPGGAAPTLLASYGKPLDIKTNWDATSLDGPDRDVLTPGGAASGMMPASYRRFDFAPYRIGPADTAIGLRLGWHEGYAGGAAFYEALALFRIDGGKLVNILSEPVSFHSDLAGEWRKDGTREREVSEGTNVLSVLPSSTSGFADLQMRTLKGKWKQVFTWDGKADRYLPVKAAPAAKSR